MPEDGRGGGGVAGDDGGAGPAARAEAADFETALDELDRILRALDRDDLRLDEALALFETGVGHLRTANRLLARARGAVEELIEEASGDLRTVAFEEAGDEEPGAGEAADAYGGGDPARRGPAGA